MRDTAITAHLGKTLTALVRLRARNQRRSMSSVIAEIVRGRIGADPKADAALAEQVLFMSVDRRIERMLREQSLLKESLLLFVRAWLEHTPPLEEEIEELAVDSAEARFDLFCDYVIAALHEHRSVAGPDFATPPEADLPPPAIGPVLAACPAPPPGFAAAAEMIISRLAAPDGEPPPWEGAP